MIISIIGESVLARILCCGECIPISVIGQRAHYFHEHVCARVGVSAASCGFLTASAKMIFTVCTAIEHIRYGTLVAIETVRIVNHSYTHVRQVSNFWRGGEGGEEIVPMPVRQGWNW